MDESIIVGNISTTENEMVIANPISPEVLFDASEVEAEVKARVQKVFSQAAKAEVVKLSQDKTEEEEEGSHTNHRICCFGVLVVVLMAAGIGVGVGDL